MDAEGTKGIATALQFKPDCSQLIITFPGCMKSLELPVHPEHNILKAVYKHPITTPFLSHCIWDDRVCLVNSHSPNIMAIYSTRVDSREPKIVPIWHFVDEIISVKGFQDWCISVSKEIIYIMKLEPKEIFPEFDRRETKYNPYAACAVNNNWLAYPLKNNPGAISVVDLNGLSGKTSALNSFYFPTAETNGFQLMEFSKDGMYLAVVYRSGPRIVIYDMVSKTAIHVILVHLYLPNTTITSLVIRRDLLVMAFVVSEMDAVHVTDLNSKDTYLVIKTVSYEVSPNKVLQRNDCRNIKKICGLKETLGGMELYVADVYGSFRQFCIQKCVRGNYITVLPKKRGSFEIF